MSVLRELGRATLSAIRRFPADLALIAVTSVAAVAIVPGLRSTPIRVVFGLLFVLFVPGYAVVSALFPESSISTRTGIPEFEDVDSDITSEAGFESLGLTEVIDARIDNLERVVLSFGTSIVVVPLVGLALSVTPWGLRTVPIVVAISLVSLVATGAAYVRRRRLPRESRFDPSFGALGGWIRTEFSRAGTRRGRAVNLLLLFSVVLAIGSLGYAVAVPNDGERFTGFYLFTQTEDGEFVTSGYPEEFSQGESRPLYVGIQNEEQRPVNYTVIVELQRMGGSNGSTGVVEAERLNELHVYLTESETRNVRLDISPTLTGEDLRLTFLLYRGTPPADPTIDNAYRDLHIWIDVSASPSASLV